ncbi:MAG: hypothetical protein GY699_01960 [Desulfobacteraceae bacterium]|nr:hypothetical protein [Desulfobacteraceae bacterium]
MHKNNALPVYITGTGATTAVGYCAPTTAASVKAGINRIASHPFMVDSLGKSFITAHAQYLPVLMDSIERFCELGLSAANEAFDSISAVLAHKIDLPVIIGLPCIRQGFSQNMVEEIKACFQNINRPFIENTHVETVCSGRSAGLMAIEKGCDIISGGQAPLCLVGGIDSWIDPDALEWLEFEGMILSDSNPWGFVPGEGAGFCLLASEELLTRQDISAVARIRAGFTVLEKNQINTDTVCTGEGLSQAISLATRDTGPVDQIICDLNGLRYKADEFGFALLKCGKAFKTPDEFMSPADFWGDAGAASGPLFISLAVHTALQGNQKGPANLAATGSDTGERSAMLIETLKQKGASE